ncbi:glycoside hydrolase family 113 [Fibrella arboris]|uniref:glycoside hydrolase family 113 n=1 Tax=Fibrella arboris TaxID=3242486 RepID=UPI0035210148
MVAIYPNPISQLTCLACLFICLVASCQNQPPYRHTGEPIHGANLVAPPRKPVDTTLHALKADGGTWVAVVPYGFCRKDDPHFFWSGNRPPGERRGGGWWGESPEGVAETVRMARAEGLKVMLKPHVWMMGGSHLDLAFEKESDWQSFEADYRGYVLAHARLADSLKIELFCMTTELDKFAQARPDFWKQLIIDVRKVYTGKLTYAANWDRYDKLPFWDQLDYIGVDAYFPLSEATTPSVKAMVKGWKKPIAELATLSATYQKPILFTEFGYRACDHTAEKPWESETDCTPNMEAQANAYTALYEALSPQPWFAGGFVWKWFMLERNRPGDNHRERDMYSPQGKPAEAVLQRTWKK